MSLLSGANPIVWVEVPARDLSRAREFYSAVFDIEMPLLDLGDLHFAFFPMTQEAPNSACALIQHPTMYTPSHDGPLVYFAVTDIEQVLERVERSGGRIFQHKKDVGEFGFVGFFEDSEGNRIGLHTRR